MAVEATENPVELRNAQRSADTRAGGVFDYASGKMSLPDSRIEREPVGGFDLVLGIEGRQTAGRIVGFGKRTAWRTLALALRGIITNQAKSLVIFLRKAV